jgi:hypothetical protein
LFKEIIKNAALEKDAPPLWNELGENQLLLTEIMYILEKIYYSFDNYKYFEFKEVIYNNNINIKTNKIDYEKLIKFIINDIY